MTTGAHPPTKGYRTIRFPLAEHEYERLLSECTSAKARLQEICADFPAWFPEALPWGSTLSGITDASGKPPRRCRRLRLDATQEVCTVAPACVMP